MDIYSHVMPDFKKSSIEKMDYLFDESKPLEKNTKEKEVIEKEATIKENKSRTMQKEKVKEIKIEI